MHSISSFWESSLSSFPFPFPPQPVVGIKTKACMWQEVKAIRGEMDDLIAPKMAIIMRLQNLFPTAAARSHPRLPTTHPVLSAQCWASKGRVTVVTSPQMKTLMKGLTFALWPSSSIKIPPFYWQIAFLFHPYYPSFELGSWLTKRLTLTIRRIILEV